MSNSLASGFSHGLMSSAPGVEAETAHSSRVSDSFRKPNNVINGII